MGMESMEHLLGEEWKITPAGGATGDAYIAQHGEQKLFLKRNSSPFLAVLSAEGIVPKLLWTKRIANGDVISAQHWLSSRKLEPEEMNKEQVASVLKKIHSSQALVEMIKRLGKEPLHPQEILKHIKAMIDEDIKSSPIVQKGLHYLYQSLPDIEPTELAVCHCDVNHNNWLESQDNQLYLIDWDGAVIADPALDIGMLLHWYVPKQEWHDWLLQYGMEVNENLLNRMKWYVAAQAIISMQWYKNKQKLVETEYWERYLEMLLS
ncbi:phosphotransferase family protein [Bacillus sp. 165]|uniref:phosphotransferase family protein n=1 Tax=Bacillus sp. 165 TaxID=1529117 RepID=UPI001ADC61E6|nr:phosphotransferase family protein [Bacillus sp. 165]MBO9130878.1 phosphotransferase family protein [Bacillus sp. 165]